MGNYSLKSVGLQNIHLQEDTRTFDDNTHVVLGTPETISLTPPVAGDLFGSSVSKNRGMIAVGAPGKNQVRVYTYAEGETLPIATLDGPVGSVEFGYSVSLDGNVLAVGDPGFNSNMGRVYSFEYKNDVWVASRDPHVDITSPEVDTDSRFGTRVVLQSNTLFVGAPGAKGSNTDPKRYGAIYPYVFAHIQQRWSNLARIVSPNLFEGAEFGKAFGVDKSNTVAVGLPGIARNLGETFENVGVVEVFSRSGALGNFWIYDTLLAPAEGGADMFFGSSISALNDHILVGAPGASTSFLYTGFGANWTLRETFSGPTGHGSKVAYNPSTRTIALASNDVIRFYQLTAAGNWLSAGLLMAEFGPMSLTDDAFVMGTPAADTGAGAFIVVPLE